MTIKKTLHWTLIFTLLASFSLYTVQNVSGHSARVALAKTLENDSEMRGTVVITSDDEDDERDLERQQREDEREVRRQQRDAEREQRRWQRFLDQFERYYDRQKVCVLNENQEQALDLLYTTDTQTLNLSDGSVDVLTVQGNRLYTSDLRRILKTSGYPNVHCKILDHKKIFYLLFSGHIS